MRVNLESYGESDPSVARQDLQYAADRVAALGWHVQTYTKSGILAALHDSILQLPTALVVDHSAARRRHAASRSPASSNCWRYYVAERSM